MVKTILGFFVFVLLFFLVSIPSIIYGLTPLLLAPIIWLIQLIIGRPVFSYKVGILALKFSTIFLLVITPAILGIYVWQPLGWIFFIWIGLYLMIRVYSGVHEKERLAIEAWKHIEAFEEKHKQKYIKYNPIITIITLVLTVASTLVGYYVGGKTGLWIGVTISVVIWCISPFARETVIETPKDKDSGPR